jgi:hypothetical protein
LTDNVKEKVLHEISRFDESLLVASSIIKSCKEQVPNIAEKIAMSQILHSFYNAIERTATIILKAMGEKIPSGDRWHKKLLDMMFGANSLEIEIIKQCSKSQLERYLFFRHVVRQAYCFELRWNDMEVLVNDFEKVWKAVKSDFVAFVENSPMSQTK